MGEAKKRRGFEAAVMERRLRRARLSERARLATVGFGVVAADDSGRFPKIIGSGVAVARQGVVLTARHVVLDLEAVVLKERVLKRSAVSVVVVSALPRHSQASDEGGEPEDPNAAPREGDPVATCGWPYGAELYPDGPRFSSFLQGSVSAVVPHPELNARARINYLMQLPVNPGNSGGGVFDPDTGDVFGVVSGRLEVGGIPTGLSIVIPAYHAEPLVDQVVEELATG